jgi:hypothetical protein
MEDAARLNKKRTLSLTSKALMLSLILVIVAVVTSVAHSATASDNKQNVSDVSLSRLITLFDPFALKTYEYESKGKVFLSTEGSSLLSNNTGSTMHRMEKPQIRIPFRPEVRSVFKPDLLG